MYEVALPVPDKVTSVPTQTDWLEPALTFGKAFTVIVEVIVAVHPNTFVTVTV